MAKRYTWKLKRRDLMLGDRTLIVGVLNVTPDSFSDGGKYEDPDRAFARALELEEEGADVLDIGAESTRPGSARVSEAEELRRLIPVLKRLKGNLRIPISVDTYKAAVAEKALEHGAEIINDPSGIVLDPQLPKVVAKHPKPGQHSRRCKIRCEQFSANWRRQGNARSGKGFRSSGW
jgi:dihydropteroate synthase